MLWTEYKVYLLHVLCYAAKQLALNSTTDYSCICPSTLLHSYLSAPYHAVGLW